MRDYGVVTTKLADQPWTAPTTDRPVHATVVVPASKSLMNRALILAAQATGPSSIPNPLRSRDTDLMADALRSLGTQVNTDSNDEWIVTPGPIGGRVTVECGLAGTVMRFIPPLVAGATGEFVIDGDEAARRRPMDTITGALRALGAEISGDQLPITVHGAGPLPGGVVTIDASASSQFVSGLLLAAPRFAGPLEVRHNGAPVPSMPHVDMTVAALRAVGVQVDDSQPNRWVVTPGPVAPWTAAIEPDLSNATPFLAAAAVTGGSVTVPGWPYTTTQGGDHFREIAGLMDCQVTLDERGLTVTGPQQLRAIDYDLHDVGELTPTVVAMTLFADGPSHLRGIGHLRGHETDRLAALAADAAAIGGNVVADDTSLRITPQPLHAGPWGAYADHRMATAGTIVGLKVPGIAIDDIACTSKTMPNFVADWERMLRTDEVSH